MLNAFIIKWTN